MGSLALCSEPDHLAQLSINNRLSKHSDIIMCTARFTILFILATSTVYKVSSCWVVSHNDLIAFCFIYVLYWSPNVFWNKGSQMKMMNTVNITRLISAEVSCWF